MSIFITFLKTYDYVGDKKIEEAAKYHLYDMRAAYRDLDIDGYAYPTDIRDIENQCMEDFKSGANWAIQEFLKDLWHPASEKPKFLGKEVLIDMEVSNKQHSTVQIYMEGQELPPTLESVRWITDWKSFIKGNGKVNVKQWLYIDDLLPNQKGK